MSLDLVKEKVFNILKFFLKLLHMIVLKVFSGNNCQYEESASISKILLRYKPPERLDWSSKEDFICFYSGRAHPNIILEDKISLYTITTKEAIFVNCGKVNVFDSTNGPFVYNVQFAAAVELIILPISSFNQISKSIPIPKIPIIHLANHGRCGSTILSQAVEAIPDSLSISELNPFTDIAELSRSGQHDIAYLKELCFSVLTCMLKHANSRKSSFVFFKCQNIAVYITDLLLESLPIVSHVYMYRQPISFVRSYEKLIAIDKSSPLSVKECKLWSGIGHNGILSEYPFYPFHYIEKLSSFAKFALVWITGAAAYNKLLAKKYKICSLKYEDFLANPEDTLLALFRYANVPISYLPDLKSVMSKDSQAGTMYSSRGVGKQSYEHCYTKITEKLECEVDKLCYDFKVPLFWNDVYLDNKIQTAG